MVDLAIENNLDVSGALRNAIDELINEDATRETIPFEYGGINLLLFYSHKSFSQKKTTKACKADVITTTQPKRYICENITFIKQTDTKDSQIICCCFSIEV